MSEPDWAEVIEVLYSEAPDWPSHEITADHLFVKKTSLDEEAATETVEALESWGLVAVEVTEMELNEVDSPEASAWGYKLTKDGFEVAHQREQAQRDLTANQSLNFLTFVLAVAAASELIHVSQMTDNLIAVVLVGGMAVMLARGELLSN